MKRLVLFILTLSLVSLSCQTIYNLQKSKGGSCIRTYVHIPAGRKPGPLLPITFTEQSCRHGRTAQRVGRQTL